MAPGEEVSAEELEERYQRGLALKNDGQYDEAIAEFQFILECAPGHARARLALGLSYCFTGLFDESIEEMLKAAECEPDWAEVHLQLGKAYCMLGQYPEAQHEFNLVLKLCPPEDPTHKEAVKQLSYFSEEGQSSP